MKKNIMDELDEITDLVVCAGMCTHSFDQWDSEEASAMRTLCHVAAERLRDIQEYRARFYFPQNEVADADAA